MIERLRKRFIAIAMMAVILVLTLIMLSINISDYRIIAKNADSILAVLCENGGAFPDSDKNQNQDVQEDPEVSDSPGSSVDAAVSGDSERDENDASDNRKDRIYNAFDSSSSVDAETPYTARYFSVLLDDSGSTLNVNTGKIASISTSEAIEMAQEIRKKGTSKGYENDYRYKVIQTSDGTLYVFLDCIAELVSAVSLLSMSIMIYFGAILLIFILILIFSKRILQPVEESYKKQKEFITNAGHELKTPLAIIDSCTDVIEMEDGESKWTKGVHEQVERLAGMTKNLIGLSRMDESTMDLDKRNFDFSKSAADTLQPFTLMAEEQGLQLILNIEPDIVLYGNERTLRQLCSILADNAVKYADPGSTITIELLHKGRKITLLSDNMAAGIKKGSHNEFFDRFYRGDASHNSAKSGYGIGLSMARSITESHGGRITAESPDGRSLKITAVLPERLSKEHKERKDPDPKGPGPAALDR